VTVLRVGVTTFGADGGRSGIGAYTVNILRAMATVGRDAELEVMAHEGEAAALVPPELLATAQRVSDRLRPPILNIAWHQLALPGWCRRRRWDVLFLPAGNRRVPLRSPCPVVGTVHDVAVMHVAGKYDAARDLYVGHVLPLLIRRLSRIITPSEHSKRDVVAHARVSPERITVIPNAVDHARFRPADPASAREAVRARLGVRPPYVLYVSRIEDPGKNHVRLIRAYARLRRAGTLQHRLVLAGSDWSGAERVHAEAARSGCGDDIVFTGFVPGADLPALYQGADALAFPSLYEGFGIPVLEAMACGVPVACSDVSSLPELAGDAALLFHPADEDALASSLERLLLDAELRARLRARGLARASLFTWEESARRTLDVLRDAAAEGA
jgi:glycosyltransferase involved in cell wall biosynthesis